MRRPDLDNGVAYIIVFMALLVIFTIWMANQP